MYKCNNCGETYPYEPMFCNDCGCKFNHKNFSVILEAKFDVLNTEKYLEDKIKECDDKINAIKLQQKSNNMKSFIKDYFISISNNKVIICKNAEGNPKTFEDLQDSKQRFLYKIGDKILTPFGIQTIKDIDYNNGSLDSHHGYEWLILVEENGNQYKPIELVGIVICELPITIFQSIIEQKPLYTSEQHHLDMQYYMEYVKANEYVTPSDWIINHKHY